MLRKCKHTSRWGRYRQKHNTGLVSVPFPPLCRVSEQLTGLVLAEAGKEKREDEIQIQMAKIVADKELTLKECNPPAPNRDSKSPKLPAFVDEKDELDSYLIRFERYAKNAKWEKFTWAIKLSVLL